ncbi:hypothetical protein DCS_04256 [Drechmeria coniospora]|uniref:Uncharacterized protein n=1 Tax=Drechmeria coniospora TaxID=98403 RepID=A0A151GJI6_DRECN|nr:hypothetical protein DCS_04256 [Drechmeria coniospora]KYK57249.1 hypothetical protein DCS_04256 [Drechmeria coniospora]
MQFNMAIAFFVAGLASVGLAAPSEAFVCPPQVACQRRAGCTFRVKECVICKPECRIGTQSEE